ncbi:MAG: glycosyltransferase family 2 protein [Clostridia bacterium]|nr:glycosyltransferase family 2 protein [Clostridia bacterium]
MDISVIIVNYNSKDKLSECLSSLDECDWSELSYEIIVVENNSQDDLGELVRSHKKTKLIKSDKNLGMGGGNNLGISHSSGNYLLITNPDIIFRVDTVLKMYKYIIDNSEAVIVGPQLLNPDGSLQYSCAQFPSIFLPLFRRTAIGRFFPGFNEKYFMKGLNYTETQVVDWLLGACLMLRRGELFESGKLFDERYFMYFEDVDLGKRVGQMNKKCVYLPSAKVIHDHKRQSARLSWYKAIFLDQLAKEHLRSWWKYFNKWGFK